MRIAICTSGLQFNGTSLETSSLGGSETAAVQLARAITKIDNQVTVFCEIPEGGEGKGPDGVTYLSNQRFQHIANLMSFDVIIVSRFADYLRLPSNAGLRILWCHDILTNPAAVANCLWQTDAVFVLSKYHLEDYTKGDDRLGHLKEHFWVTRNGIDPELIEANKRPKVPGKVIYTSRPERGLFELLRDIMPRIWKENPSVKLHYSAYDLKNFPLGEEVKQLAQACDDLAKSYGDKVVKLGALKKADLYAEISSAELLLYPTRFPEIQCITALEAAACGTPIITTKDFALVTSVADGKSGVLVPGHPGGEEYSRRFATVVLHTLKTPKVMKRLTEGGPKHIKDQGFTWDQIAKEWVAKFESMFADRWKNSGQKMILEMERSSDIQAGLQIAKERNLDTSRLEKAKDIVREVPTDYEAVKKMAIRFDRVTESLSRKKVEPKTILDLYCGDAAFGLHAAQKFKDAEITCVEGDVTIRERLKNGADQAKLKVNILSTDELDGLDKKYDLVFCGDFLDMVVEPHEFAKTVSKLVVDGGSLVFTSRYGASQATCQKEGPVTHNRLWNFVAHDFIDMFGEGGIAQVEEGVSNGGDLLAHWVIIIGKEQAANAKPIQLEHRTRLYRPYVKLGVAMIARDAEDWMVKVLKPLRPIADYIHIALDDRTTDTTVSLSMEHGADEVWPIAFDNFSQARNESISKLPVDTDWLLWIDTDEILLEGAKLRRYLRSRIFDGFGIFQRHLMTDVHGTHDVPIRLVRRSRDGVVTPYRFKGYVHEHCEGGGPDVFGQGIQPSILLPDIDLAHYGYPNETARRNKCSNRNMELLIRDIEENGRKGRKLSWVLGMRDYLNIAKWRLEIQRQPIQYQSIEHYLVQAAVRVFLKYFQDPKDKYHGLSYGMYQEALALLGSSGVPFEDRPHPPFEIRLAASGSIGGVKENNVEAQKIWFIDMPQLMAHFSKVCGTMGVQMGVCHPQQVAQLLNANPETAYTWNDHDIDLLRIGLNNIDATTGRLQRV